MALNDYTPVLSTITLPSGNIYYFKDAYARELLETLVNYSKFLGVTTTELEDGIATNPITISGESITADNGDIAIYGSKEFIWNGTAWAEFGDLDALKDLLGELAYVDTASGSYTPKGIIASPFVGTEKAVNVDGAASGDINADFTGTEGDVVVSGTLDSSEVVVSGTIGTATYTPAGTITAPTFNGTRQTVSITYKPDGTISAEFTGTEGNVEASGVPKGIIQIAEVVKSLTGNYTPTGSITNTEITVTTTSTPVATVLTSGTAPSISSGLVSISVSNESLVVTDITATAWNAGAMPTFSTANVLTSATAAFTSTPEFVGDKVLISGTFTGSNTTFSGKFTPEGSVGASFNGTSTTLSSTFTPAGSVTAPQFSGTGTRLVGTIASASINATGKFTPSGTISGTFNGSVSASGTYTPEGTVTATFTGSAATITVSATE